jgi:hypothetical protein
MMIRLQPPNLLCRTASRRPLTTLRTVSKLVFVYMHSSSSGPWLELVNVIKMCSMMTELL